MLDLVEEFRVAVVDSVLFPLFVEGNLASKRNFIKADGQHMLSKKGKQNGEV